jgi:hypothetical protein
VKFEFQQGFLIGVDIEFRIQLPGAAIFENGFDLLPTLRYRKSRK